MSTRTDIPAMPLAGEDEAPIRDIGWAIRQLRSGKLVRRPGWNGKNMHLYLEPGEDFLIGDGVFKGQHRIQEPFISLYTAKGTHQPGWNASTPDLLATDWEIAG